MTDQLNGNKKLRYSAPALSKGLDILELLAGQSQPLGLKEISDLLGRQKSEIFRMLSVLEERGYIHTLDHSDKYVMTMKLMGIAHQMPLVSRLTTVALPFQKKLTSKIGQSCHIVVDRGDSAVVIAQYDSATIQKYSVQIGTRLSYLKSCSGMVLLAFSDPNNRKSLLSSKKYSSKEIKEFELKLPKIKAAGCVEIASPIIHGVRDIGFPLFDYTDNVIASFTVPFLEYKDGSNPVSYDEAIDELRYVCKEISLQLGQTNKL